MRIKDISKYLTISGLIIVNILVITACNGGGDDVSTRIAFYSNRDGFQYNQPFFWAISESSDATLFVHYMARRGFKHGVEYRYVLGAESKGAVMYDSLMTGRLMMAPLHRAPQGTTTRDSWEMTKTV